MTRAILAALLCLATACGTGAAPAVGDTVRGQVVVQAAASLTDAFSDIVDVFEAAHPDAAVVVNFAGSQTLAAQILQGAPVDVFASADTIQMDVVAAAGLVDGPSATFATNGLAIAVETGNPLGIAGPDDLAEPGVVLVLPAPGVPAGDLAARALDAAGVAVTPASLEVDVRAVLAKVRLGEADAGIVYTSDVLAAGDAVEGIAIDGPAAARYPIAVLAGAPNPAAAAAFVRLVLSQEGQRILRSHGLGAP